MNDEDVGGPPYEVPGLNPCKKCGSVPTHVKDDYQGCFFIGWNYFCQCPAAECVDLAPSGAKNCAERWNRANPLPQALKEQVLEPYQRGALESMDRDFFNGVHQILGLPAMPSQAESNLRQLAEEYHRRTEDYDRTVCTGPVLRGGIMATTNEEFSQINRHAKAVLNELGITAASLGFTLTQWREAVCDAKLRNVYAAGRQCGKTRATHLAMTGVDLLATDSTVPPSLANDPV